MTATWYLRYLQTGGDKLPAPWKQWPAPKLRAKDPKTEPDVFSEPFGPADIERILAQTGRPLRGRTEEQLRSTLNAAAIYWAASARAEAKDEQRTRENKERKRFVLNSLGGVYRHAFKLPPRAAVTIRQRTLRNGRQDRVDGPFVRFVISVLAILNYPITGDAIRDMQREKKATKG